MPVKPVAACSTGVCSEPGTVKGKCRDHARVYDEQIKKDTAERRGVYTSRRWKGLRTLVFKQQGGKCAVPDCYNLATDLDHVTPLRDGGDPYDRANLQGLCKKHHSSKTRREVFGFKGNDPIYTND